MCIYIYILYVYTHKRIIHIYRERERYGYLRSLMQLTVVKLPSRTAGLPSNSGNQPKNGSNNNNNNNVNSNNTIIITIIIIMIIIYNQPPGDMDVPRFRCPSTFAAAHGSCCRSEVLHHLCISFSGISFYKGFPFSRDFHLGGLGWAGLGRAWVLSPYRGTHNQACREGPERVWTRPWPCERNGRCS